MNIFQRIIKFMDSTEVSFVTLLAKVMPLLVPIIPAYIGYSHVINQVTGLGFDEWAGWVYGAVIEGLGYASIYKAVQFWEHNRKYTSEKNRAPLLAAVIIYAIYLVVTLAVNVMLDYKAGVEGYKVAALGLISMLSIPSGLLMSISAIHTERTNERERANEQAKLERAQQRNERPERATRTNGRIRTGERAPRTNVPQPVNEHPMGFPTDEQAGERVRRYIEQVQANENRTPGQSEIARAVSVSKSTADKWLKQK
jgi:putative Mn2+ efflux pump MntP